MDGSIRQAAAAEATGKMPAGSSLVLKDDGIERSRMERSRTGWMVIIRAMNPLEELCHV